MVEGVVTNALLIIFGAAIGSFINVLGFRYSTKNKFGNALRGRSKCQHGGHGLKWLDLIPVFSFLFLRGKCRTCHKPISWRYPIVEALAGLVALFVPLQIGFGIPALLWVLGFWTLLLISIIDLRLQIIPNSLVIFLAALGVGSMAYQYTDGLWGDWLRYYEISSLGAYYLTFRIGSSILLNHVYATLVALALFGGIYIASKGKAMGLGDVKLVAALGAWLVFPDMVLAMALSFIVGSIVGLTMMALGKLKFKSGIPFGPFIATGVTLVFFFGYDIVNAYFKIFGFF
ncbi:MAG: prepilin peptidase [Candidatus Colwellbacteria bacterium]|nr:prepilin peptidase [Candidatus Colwellbacteria bacterium]